MNMKLLATGALAAAFVLNSLATEPLLSPRAKGNQIKIAANSPGLRYGSELYVLSGSSALLSPRAKGNQIKSLVGLASDTNAALACRQSMGGSPRAVTECSSHSTMPGCAPDTARK